MTRSAGASADPRGSTSRGRSRVQRILHSPWFHLAAVLAVLALVQGAFVKVYAVPSTSMQQTLQVSDRILVDRTAYVFGEPERGDVVVFTASETWNAAGVSSDSWIETALKWVGGIFGIGPGTERSVVKRIIAIGGETIECCDTAGGVLVNGEALEEPYVYLDPPFELGSFDCATDPVSPRCFAPFTVPPGHFVVLGDQRGNSADSVVDCRSKPPGAGCSVATVKRSDIVGRAFAIVWPLHRLGGLD